MHEPEQSEDDAAAVAAETNQQGMSTSETSALGSRHSHRKRLYQVVAALGATAAVGAGVFLAQQMTSDPHGRADMSSMPDPPVGVAPAESGPTGGSTPESSPGGSTGASPRGSTGAPVQGPRTLPPSEAPQPTASPIRGIEAPEDVPATVSTRGSDNGQTMRVVTARGDLTGQREMVWAGDPGRPVGEARCTQNFRFSPDRPPSVRPTMLLCWRTSAQKSVYVITVRPEGTPSEQETVAVIGREWSKLG